MNSNLTPKKRTSPATIVIAVLLGLALVLILAQCATRDSRPAPAPTACPSDVQDSTGVGDAFSDGFQQGLTGCK